MLYNNINRTHHASDFYAQPGGTFLLMVTTLYNAPSTINHYYQQEVQHDMYGGGWHEKGIV